jgi:hypothetical protein
MTRLLTAVMVWAWAIPAYAEPPSYNYFEAGYQRIEFDLGGGVDVDGDGFGFGGSYEVVEDWHLIASYSSIGLDFGIDLNQLQIGGGYHTDISDITTFYGNLLWANVDVDTGAFGSADDSGFGIAIGIRTNFSERLELGANLSRVDFGDGGDGTSVGAEALYRVGDTFSLGLTINLDDDVFACGLGARIYF